MASSAATLDVDAGQDVKPSYESSQDDVFPKNPDRLESALVRMLAGVETENRGYAVVRRIPVESASDLQEGGAEVYFGTVAGERRAIEIIERRSRVVIVGGDIERSTYSGRLVRAGRMRFADALRKEDARCDNDNDDVGAGDEAEPVDERFDELSGTSQLAPPEVERDDQYNRRTPAGSLLGVEHRFSKSGDRVVVPLKQKPRFTDRTSPPPPVRQTLTAEEIMQARDTLHQVKALLPVHVVAILEQYRAANFRAIGEFEGKRGRHAGRVGQVKVLAACKAFSTALLSVELLAAA